MITLDVVDLTVIAGQTLGIGTEAALNRLDVPAARDALAEADFRGVVISDQDGAAEAGIALMHALLRHRPFPRHGEQFAVAAGLQFLALNGWRAELDPPATAAVVVEALADGQLSPAAAAAWLSPRLTADSRLRPRWGSVHSFRSLMPASAGDRAAGPKPASVAYAQLLLFIQAGCWALAGLASLLAIVAAVGDGGGVFVIAGMGTGAGLTVAKAKLAQRVSRERSRRLWRTIIATELAMTGFGLLWLLVPTPWVQVPGLCGAVLSLAAVLCMTLPRARQYFDASDALPGKPKPGELSGSASFGHVIPTGRGLVVAWLSQPWHLTRWPRLQACEIQASTAGLRLS